MTDDKLRQKIEALAGLFEEISNKEPDNRLFKTAQRDARVSFAVYGRCAKKIRDALTETEKADE